MSTRCLRGVNVALGAGDGASVPARSAGIQLPTCRNPGAGAAWGACTEVQVQDGAEQGPAPLQLGASAPRVPSSRTRFYDDGTHFKKSYGHARMTTDVFEALMAKLRRACIRAPSLR